MIINQKSFIVGMVLMLTFIGIFIVVMSPVFGNGRNGLEYADDMFNSLSKGSAYFIKDEINKAGKLAGTSVDVKLKAEDNTESDSWATLYRAAGANVKVTGTEVSVKGDLGSIFNAVLVDCDAMYKNQGEQLNSKYGMEGRAATYAWYTSLKSMNQALEGQKEFAQSAAVQGLMKKTIEPAYNYYGIEVKKVADYKWIVFFLMVFYLAYTLWYGFSFYYLFEGIGITATKSAKKVEA